MKATGVLILAALGIGAFYIFSKSGGLGGGLGSVPVLNYYASPYGPYGPNNSQSGFFGGSGGLGRLSADQLASLESAGANSSGSGSGVVDAGGNLGTDIGTPVDTSGGSSGSADTGSSADYGGELS